MGQSGRAIREVVLSAEERETLQRWARRHTSAQALAMRCRIVLACAEGGHNGEVAERLGLNRNTVAKWRNRFIEHRLDGLHDEPRPGKPRTISDDDVERVIVATLETKPANATHWSTRSMADATGMSRARPDGPDLPDDSRHPGTPDPRLPPQTGPPTSTRR